MEIYKFKCKNCGSREYVKIDDTTYKCAYCGYKEEVFLDKKKENKEDKEPALNEEDWKAINEKGIAETKPVGLSNLVMLIICLLFGTMGIHKFVEKKIWLGVLYLLTFGFFYIGWIIDVVHYIGELQKEKQRLNNDKQ